MLSVFAIAFSELNDLSKKNADVNRNCRDAVNKLHEVMKLLDLAKMNLEYNERRYSTAVTLFSLWIGLAVADFVAAATVVYSIGPVTGMKPEFAFWNPEGAEFMNFTWFGLGLVLGIFFALISLCYSVACSLSLRATRKKVREMNEKLKEAKSSIIEACPMELWYSGEA